MTIPIKMFELVVDMLYSPLRIAEQFASDQRADFLPALLHEFG